MLFDPSYFKNVFVPSAFSLLLASRLDIKEGDKVLDLGTGSGILSLIALKMGASEVFSLDLNPFAIRAAEFNAKINGLEGKLHTIYGDMHQFLHDEPSRAFDAIISSPPQLPSTEEQEKELDWEEMSYAGGRDGRKHLDDIIMNSRRHLAKGGKLELATTSVVNYARTSKMIVDEGFALLQVSKIEIPFRAVYILAKSLIDNLQASWGETLYSTKEGIPYETIYAVISELK